MTRGIGNFWIYLLVIIFILILLFPLYIMFKISVSSPQDIFTEKPPYLIRHFTFSHFKDVIASGSSFFSPFKKSLITAFLVSLLALLISIPAAYAVSKFNYRIRYIFILLIFITRMIPEVSIALPVSIAFIKMGLFDTIAGLLLAHLIRILPITCFILVGVFSGFPVELERQALIDGCSRIKALFKVVLPLSRGGICAAGIFSFFFSWDEFIYASYLCLAEPTMPIKMYYYISRGDLFYSATYAVIITIPVLILTFIFQEHIKPGYLSGAIKG
jgi:trehalose transport system permease protein